MKSQFKINIKRLCLVLLLAGCGAARGDKMAMVKEERMQDSIINNSENIASSSAAVENKKDSIHKFIRTAELKFKAKSVVKATYAIEDIATKFNGFVTYTNLQSTIDYKNTIPISADSSLETTYFTVQNTMALKVPNTLLDTTLKEISRHIDFLDYRIIKADDVSLQLLVNKLTQTRVRKHEQRLISAIDNRGKKLNETTNAEENLLAKQENADNALISNLSLNEQINYSTISLHIYQRQSIQRELNLNDKIMEAYEPSFSNRLKDALIMSWHGLQNIIILIANIWVLIVLAIFAYLTYRKYFKK